MSRSAIALLAAAAATTTSGSVASASNPKSLRHPAETHEGNGNDNHGRKMSAFNLSTYKDPKAITLRSKKPVEIYTNAKPSYHHTVYLDPDGPMADRAPKQFVNEMGNELYVPPTDQELPPMKDRLPCKPAKAWHDFDPLNCNTFHEIDPGMNVHSVDNNNYIKFLDHGGRRDAWVYKRNMNGLASGNNGDEDRVILKTLRWDKPYGEKYFDNQRDDALVSERASGSPHVIDTYGFCGMSTFNEFAGGGNFETYIERNKAKTTPEELLVFARNISVGLADVHEINVGVVDPLDPAGVPANIGTIVHHDFRHHNLLLTDDNRVKLSDFNTAQLMMWNFDENESCGFNWYKHCGETIWGADRSPEECAGDHTNIVSQKAEVFHLGALLHFLLSKRPHPYVEGVVWQDGVRTYKLEGPDEKLYYEKEMALAVRQKILDGEVPLLPEEATKSTDPAIKAILKAKSDAMAYDVKDRPTARQVANELVRVASELGIMDGTTKPNILDGDAKGTAVSSVGKSEAKAVASGAGETGGAATVFPQNERGLHPLEFIHTATTGGSNIEYSGSHAGIAWGVCKYEHTWGKDARCSAVLKYKDVHKIKPLASEEWKCAIESKPWHCPPTSFKSGKNNYEGVDTFTIVQDPYSRMISEYYAFVKKKSLLEERGMVVDDIDDKDFMNKWIIEAADTAIEKGVCYFGHCIPMTEYVYSDGKKIITHVLKVENLEEEFIDLMKQYKLNNVKLEDAKMRKEGALGVEDLSADAIAKINEWGKLDFEHFGYDMMDPASGKKMESTGTKSSGGVSKSSASNIISIGSGGDAGPMPQNDRGMHKLEFVHIAKTGGTSIEHAASQHGIAWGICKFEEYWSWSSRCKPIQPYRQHIKIQQLDDWECNQKAWAWHCPPFNYKSKPGVNQFEGSDTFTVVRNPYSLMVSEYYYLFQKKPYLVKDLIEKAPEGNLNDPKFMNRWISDAAQKATNQGFCYFGHCIPQYQFAYADGKRFVDHVLKMENLSDEFPALMERYNLPVELEHVNSSKKSDQLTVEDLSKEAIEKINEWAKLDFEYFGYEKLDPLQAKYHFTDRT